ncbi:hypothetical protein ACN9MZ_08030 [Pseudoduganella sp. S-14]|uniref:hypothetical protein n=1 Tax=Pseudoduganella sp. S-14 TaxID=3404065 RepID=UPI003CEA5A4E
MLLLACLAVFFHVLAEIVRNAPGVVEFLTGAGTIILGLLVALCLLKIGSAIAYLKGSRATRTPLIIFSIVALFNVPVGTLPPQRQRAARLAWRPLRAAKPVSEYRIGDRVGIFSLLYLSQDEVLPGDSDKHLDVVLSVCKAPQGAVSVFGVVRASLSVAHAANVQTGARARHLFHLTC